ncbi:Cytosine/adenosine deaminase [Dethiosulfatibacter aminovorans DSM 17477]|uniref:Cytosine/adenosine deaminase n=1 Tax=Dethiosulfatibacter aminovorans DSM 17477 TaxID=1121476 RepID=A0A1M6HCH3_9FIRM|nr:amidohydrolase family protein [Dethiosulfatibacter aminovorans]SHJ19854.1 Cytosine/adenosine deaminase [Dethiosulfatibacter aminovorans DSM 17477]
MKAIINLKIYDYENYIDNGYIIFDKKIIEVGHMDGFKSSHERIDGKGKLLIPGLVNFHTHVYSTLFRGLDMKASPQNFKELLDDVWWKFDSRLLLEDIGLSAEVYCDECLKSGVTSIIDHHASGEVSGSLDVLRNVIIKKFGMKAMFCFETSDRFDLGECIRENLHSVNLGDGLFGLHALMSLSDESLEKIKIYAKNSPIHVHVAESIEDEEHSIREYGMTVVDRLDKFGLLNEDSILAHCVNINDREGELIGRKKCAVALNPTSNMNNAVGIFDYNLFTRNNIKILIGTDGLGVNVMREWQNLYYMGKQSTGNPSGIVLDEIRNHIVESYRYFNRISGSRIGRIKSGYDADFLVFDYNPPTPMNSDNAFGHVFFGVFDSMKPRYVIADGHYKINDYKPQIEFEMRHDLVNDLWERIGETL